MKLKYEILRVNRETATAVVKYTCADDPTTWAAAVIKYTHVPTQGDNPHMSAADIIRKAAPVSYFYREAKSRNDNFGFVPGAEGQVEVDVEHFEKMSLGDPTERDDDDK